MMRVPKRSFSADALQAFKALLMTHIPEGQFLTSPTGFPVLPLATRATNVAPSHNPDQTSARIRMSSN